MILGAFILIFQALILSYLVYLKNSILNQSEALANLMFWMSLWHHERLTGNAKTEVNKKLLIKVEEFQATLPNRKV